MAVKKYRIEGIISKLLFGILVLVIIIPILFPLHSVLISSSKNMTRVCIMPPELFGFKPILDNYIYMFKTQYYGAYMMNSAIVAMALATLSLLLGVSVVYAIARYKMRKANTVTLTVRLLSNISILLSYYFIFSKPCTIDTRGVLILSHMIPSLPPIVWIMVGFFSDLPLEPGGVAIVDSCTRQRYFKDALLPVSAPGLVTYSTLSFLGSWSSFWSAFILSNGKTGTLPVSLQYFMSDADIRWGRMLAATVITVVPTIILTMLLQKYIM